MRILALDVGKRRTGAAFADTNGDFVMALETISHTSVDELIASILKIINEKKIEKIVLGLPLLLGGSEGEQTAFVRSVAALIAAETPLPQQFIDERYTSSSKSPCLDPDAVAACKIAEVALSKP